MNGRVEFADRHGHLARVAWMECKSAPDLERIMNEFHRNRLKTDDKVAFASFDSLSFRKAASFVLGVYRNGEPCQAAMHHPKISLISVWTFPQFSEERLRNLWLPILESFQENSQDGWREWAAWGLDFHLPSHFSPVSVSPMPANVTLSFESTQKRRFDAHRWGLPEIVLAGGSLESFYSQFLAISIKCKILSVTPRKFGSFDGVEAEFRQRGFFDMEKLYGRWWRGHGVCWFDTESMRMNAAEQSAPHKTPKMDFKDVFPVLKEV